MNALAALPTPRATILADLGRDPDGRTVSDLRAEISASAGALAPQVLGLIERRAEGVSEVDSAAFILRSLLKGGADRERLLAHAMKSTERVKLERSVSALVQKSVRPIAGRPFSASRIREIQRELVKLLRRRLPNTPVDALKSAASAAIEYRADRISIRIEALADLVMPPKLAS